MPRARPQRPQAVPPAQIISARRPRFEAVQVLRYIAASIVVLYHSLHYVLQYAKPSPDHAWTLSILQRAATFAVLQFFCISGFVVALSLQGRTPMEFLRARLLRVYPALWLAVALALLLAPSGSLSFDRRLLYGLALLPVGDRATWTLGVEWTLVHEVVFYVAAAGLWLFRSNRVLIAGHAVWLAFIVAGPWIAPGWRLHFITLEYVLSNPPTAGFILGLFLYFCLKRLDWIPTTAAALAGIALVTWAASVEENWRSYGMDLGCTLVLLAVTRINGAPSWAARCGDWSYGVYLIHVPFVITTLRHRRIDGEGGFLLFAATMLTLATLFGMAEHWLYRRYFSKLR